MHATSALSTDVLVIGAGPAGCACAFKLARLGVQVTLAAMDTGKWRVGETCGPRVLNRLVSEGMPPPLEDLGLPILRYRSAWGSNDLEARDLRFWFAGDALAIDRPRLERWLLTAARAVGVQVLDRCVIGGGQRIGQTWSIEGRLDTSSIEIAANFVIEATGRAARSVLQSDATRSFSDRLMCLHTLVSDAGSDRSSVLVEACPAGWWYAVPASNGQRLLALFTDADLVGMRAERGQMFRAQLAATHHIRQLALSAEPTTEIQLCDARTGARSLVWRDRWLSVGDAAWSIDPLSGAGIQRSIGEALDAASAVARFVADGNQDSLRHHALGVGKSLLEALRRQDAYYEMEQRWPTGPFWRRRVAARAEVHRPEGVPRFHGANVGPAWST